MRKKRILAMMLAASMIFQSFGTVSFAAETTNAAETSAEGVIVEDVVPKEATEAAIEETVVEDTVAEEQNETVTGIEETTTDTTEESVPSEVPVVPEDEVSEEETQEEAVIEEIEDITEEAVEKITETFDAEAEKKDEKEMADAEHLVDDTLGYTVSNLKVTPGKYYAQIEFEAERDIYDCSILYTTEELAGESFFPGVTSVSESEIDSSEIYNCSYLSVEDQWTEDGYKFEGQFAGDFALQPNTKYYIRIVKRQWDYQNSEYRYRFLTMPESFTTGAQVTSTEVTFSDFKVESVGYNSAYVSWTLNNPLNEYITNDYVCIKSDTEDDPRSFGAEKYRDNETGNYVPNKYFALIATNGKPVKAWIECTVYTGDRNETEITSDKPITVVPKEFKESYVSVASEAGSGSFHASVKVEPYYESDDLNLKCFYREKGSEEYEQDFAWFSYNGVCDYQLSGLKSNQSYEYYFVLGADYYGSYILWTGGSAESPLEFTTKSVTVYEDSQFPDETLRNYLKAVAGVNEDGKLTSAGLESIQSIYSYDFRGQAPVTSLEGLQYCINLTELNLEGQEITDASVVSTLKNLTSIYLSNNDLRELPDLSGLGSLRYASFSWNLIKESSITKSKLPAAFLNDNPDWLSETKRSQREAFSAVVADTYYAIGDTHPFIIQLNSVKGNRRYTLSVEIAGTVSDITKEIYGDSSVLYIRDLGNVATGKQTIKVSVTDQYGKKWLDNQSYTVNFEDDKDLAEDVYVNPTDTSIEVSISANGMYSDSEDIELQVLDGDKVLGTCDKVYLYTRYGEDRYQNIFDGYIDLERTVTEINGSIYLTRYLSAGNYDLKLITPDGETRFEDIVHVSNQAVIEEVYTAYGYDNDGDYIYIQIYGVNIDTDKIYPVLYKDGKAVTQLVAVQKEYNRNIIYKLKKLDKSTYWTEDGYYDCQFKAADGYDYKILNPTEQIYVRQSFEVLFSHYNYKKGVYEVKFSSALKEGTEVSAKVVEDWDSESVIAHGQGKISDGMLRLAFKDGTGTAWIPQQDTQITVEYIFKNSSGVEEHHKVDNWVEWYNYSNYSVNERDTFLSMESPYYETGVKEIPVTAYVAKSKVANTDTLTISMVDSRGNVVGESVSLTYKSETTINQNVPAYRFEGTWKSANGITEAGCYSLQLKKGNTQLTAYGISVYAPDVFYMRYQEAERADDDTVCVRFDSEKLYGDYVNKYNRNVTEEQALTIWKNSYRLEVFDRVGNKITGWKPVAAEYDGFSFYVYITGLPKDYVGFYFKITDQEGKLGVDLTTGQTYYSTAYDANETYGSWDELTDSNECWALTDYDKLHGIEGIGVNSLNDWPVTVTVTRPYDITPLKTLTVSGKGNVDYYFTASDLSGLAKDEVYKISMKSARGSSSTATGYIVSDDTIVPEVPVKGVKLDKTAVSIGIEDTFKLTATVNPANATDKSVTWSSDNVDVAVVDESGQVTAIGVGTAKITVTTGNGKTATCTVKVLEYSISAEKLEFDLYNNKTPVTLKVSDGITEGIRATWSSSDTKIATVSSTGKVTPVGVGEATIQAVVKNGPTFTCHVTVKNDIIERIELSQNTLVLNADDKVQLKATVLPKNTTLSTEITWSSSDEDAVSVDKEGNVTALKEGASATITAAAVNGVTASCEVKAYQYKLNETELNFDLYNNKTPITLKVSDGIKEGIAATWASEDSNIATVAGGTVTPVSVGTTTITAAIKNGPELTCKVTVTNDYIKEVTLDKTEYEMNIVKGSENKETVTLKAFINPADTTLSKNVTWESSNIDVATVDQDGTVTAVGAGTADITVKVKDASEGNKSESATCTITVYGEITAPEIGESLLAITNSQAKLKDVPLPEDENGTWNWENPETTLKQFACMEKANFTAIYTPKNEFVKPVKAEIPVRLVTISKLTLEADKTTIMMAGDDQAAEKATITPKWTVTGDASVLDECETEWKSSNEKVATVEDGVVTAVGKGSAKITAVVEAGDRNYTAAVTIKVLENQKPVEITVNKIDIFEKSDGNDAKYTADLSGEKDANKGLITIKLENASKLTVGNSNAKVVKTSSIKAVKGQTGIFEIPFELLEGGTAKITLTANDALKTTKEILLTVKDAKPSMEVSTLTINKLQSLEESFMIHPSKDYPVTAIKLGGRDAGKFDLKVAEDKNPTGEYVLKANEGTGKSNGYKVTVIATANRQEYSFPLTVKVTEVKPKVTVKQSGKINLFYTNSKAELMFTTAEKITGVELKDCEYIAEFNDETGTWIVKPKADVKDTIADKAGILEITLEGWKEPLKVNFTVGVEKKTPKLALTSKSGVLYPAFGIDSAQTSVLMDGKTFALTEEVSVDVTDKKGNEISGYGYACETDTENDRITFNANDAKEAKNASVLIKVKDENWNDSVTLSYALTVKTNKPAVKLPKSTVQLNVNQETFDFDVASTQVMWKDATEFAPEGIIVEPADAKAKGAVNSGLEVEVSGDQIVAKLNSRTVAKGTYKFKVSVKASEAYKAVATLNVKVVDTVAKKSIGLSTKGSIDVLNRTGSYVTVTPKLSAINGTITGVTLIGRNANLFTPTLVDGTIQIRVKDNVSVITNYSYGVKMNLTITNEDEETMTVVMDETKLSLKQGSVKLAVSPAAGVLYSNADSKVVMDIQAILKGANNPEIEKVELMNYTDAFEYDDTQKELTMQANGEAAKGKSYTLQFEVTLKDKADNVKPMILKYKVTVK